MKLVALDLASFDSIEACAAEVIKNEERIDYLVLNAGIMATPQSTTKEVTAKGSHRPVPLRAANPCASSVAHPAAHLATIRASNFSWARTISATIT